MLKMMFWEFNKSPNIFSIEKKISKYDMGDEYTVEYEKNYMKNH